MLSSKCSNKFINENNKSVPKNFLFCGGTKVNHERLRLKIYTNHGFLE